VEYLSGGVDSGFQSVKHEVVKRLFQIKGKGVTAELGVLSWGVGKRDVKVAQVDCSAASLNKGDVFILETSKKIFQWNGQKSSRVERAKGLQVSLPFHSLILMMRSSARTLKT
jgi:hypothetical protein